MSNGSERVRLTRRTWANYFLPATVLAAILGGIAAWWVGQTRFLAAPLGLLVVWGLLSALTPRGGQMAATIRGTPGAPTLLLYLGASLVLMMALMAIDSYWVGNPWGEPLRSYHLALYAPPFVVLLFGAYLADRQK